MTVVEADLLPSPGHRSCRFRTLVMLQELNIVCWQLWGVRRLGTRWQLIVAGVRSGELCCALQPHEIFALDSLAAPRAPRFPALRHSINIFQAGNIFNPISLCWDDRISACGHLNTRDTNRYMIDTTNTGSRPHNTQHDDNLKWFMYKLQRSAYLHHFTRSSSSIRCMQTECWCLDIDN